MRVKMILLKSSVGLSFAFKSFFNELYVPTALIFSLASCAHRPPLVPAPAAPIKVYVVDDEILRATELRDDLMLDDTCRKQLCHVFVGESYVSVKKLLIDLEEELRECQVNR